MASGSGSSSKAVAKGGLHNTISKNGVSLSINVSDIDILLYPSDRPVDSTANGQEIPDDAQKNTTVVVHISLTTPATAAPPASIASLYVELRSEETIGFPSGIMEHNTPHQIRTRVDSATGMQLERGTKYQWDVPIEISGACAPYDRGTYGRVYHKIVASIEWPGWSARLRATGKRMEIEQVVFLAAMPQSVETLNYAHTYTGLQDVLGPVVLHTRTRQLTVGGYLRVALSLPSAAPGIELHQLKLTLIQHTTLVSRKNPPAFEQCRPSKIKFLQVDREELEGKVTRSDADNPCDTLTSTWVARLPKDNVCRNSTVPGSQAAIRHDHEIEISIIYRDALATSTSQRRFTASWPVQLSACSMLWHSIKLPSYSESDPNPVPEWRRDEWEPDKFANIHVSQATCACGQSLEKLLSWEDEGDDEERVSSSHLMREAVELANSSARIRSRSRQRSAFSRNASRNASRNVSRNASRDASRDASAANSIHSPEEQQEEMAEEEDEDNARDIAEEDEELRNRQIEARRQQKAAQLYVPTP